MTTENCTVTPSFDYPHANERLYAIAPGVTTLDLRDALDGKFALLESMLFQTTGEQGEGFRCCNDQIQDSYLHGCAMLATEVHQLYKQLESRASFPDTVSRDATI